MAQTLGVYAHHYPLNRTDMITTLTVTGTIVLKGKYGMFLHMQYYTHNICRTVQIVTLTGNSWDVNKWTIANVEWRHS